MRLTHGVRVACVSHACALQVWVAYGDMPALWTLVGGGLLFLTLVGHEIAGLLEAKSGLAAGETPYRDAEGSLDLFGGGVPRVASSDNSLFLTNIGGHRSPLGERFLLRTPNSSRPGSLDSSDPKERPLLEEAFHVDLRRGGP